jgi:hypothetical protein
VPFSETVEVDFTARGFIDEHIRAELVRLKLPASPLSTDAEFQRRVYLDVIGGCRRAMRPVRLQRSRSGSS